jgi:serine protease AprX
VVAATGNAGFYTGRSGPGLTSPARDPQVIAVGATDTNKTLSTADDQVASFSSSGVGGPGGTKNPDLIAPGRWVISLAVPGSYIDQAYGATGAVTGGYLRGSGTSQAAAVVSGAAALVLSQHPTWTNTQVKALLVNTATKLKVGLQTDAAQGQGHPQPDQRPWGDQRRRQPAVHQLHRHRHPGERPRERPPGRQRRGPQRRTRHLR